MRVLLANDQSPRATDAARLLAGLPFPAPLDTKVISVVDVPTLPESVESHPRWSEILELLLKDAEDSNGKVGEYLGVGAGSIQSLVRRGDAAEEILNAANAEEIDLLVLGALGHSAFERITLGSVSDRVATHAECSTLVVRPAWTESSAEHPLRVLVAYDGSEPSKIALEQVAQFNWPPESEIVLVQIITQLASPYYYGFAADMPSLWQEARDVTEQRLDDVAATLRERGLNISIDVRTADHHGEEICRRVKELAADIVFIGDHGYGGLKRFLLGSVSRYVLRHSLASVWINRQLAHVD